MLISVLLLKLWLHIKYSNADLIFHFTGFNSEGGPFYIFMFYVCAFYTLLQM